MDCSEIAFLDLETSPLPLAEQNWTVPAGEQKQKWTIVEFGVILICPEKLVELDEYCTLIKPADLSLISEAKSNGITRDAVAKAPKFEEVADKIYGLLNGRVWAGHNIVRFDCECIRDAFTEIGRPPPIEKGLIDSFPLFEEKFRRRAGNMKESNFSDAILSKSPTASRKRKASTEIVSEKKSDDFLEPNQISTTCLRATIEPSQWGTHKMTLLHKDIPLGMRSINMKILYGISKKYFRPTGKPRLSFVVEPCSETCNILKECETFAQNFFSNCNDKSEWKPLLTTKYGINPAVRIHIETTGSGGTSTYSTDLYWTDSEGTSQRLASKTVDINELDKLLVSGKSLEADYNFDIYDYTGIRLVARRLTVGC